MASSVCLPVANQTRPFEPSEPVIYTFQANPGHINDPTSTHTQRLHPELGLALDPPLYNKKNLLIPIV